MGRLPLGFILCTIAAAMASCRGGGNTTPESASPPAIQPIPLSPNVDSPPDAAPEQNPGASSRTLVIHPLTRVGTDASGKPAIILHLEFLDTFDQAVKAFGTVRVSLSGPGPDGSREWHVDLTDPKANALMYDDLVTRTYTIPLGGIPTWLILWSQAEIKTSNAANAGPEIKVWFTLEPPAGSKPDDSGRVLRATRRLTR